jgi:hypothetical protein
VKLLVASIAACLVLSAVGHGQQSGGNLLVQIDHLVYATPDLALGVERIERLLGVRATPGGQHVGLGTRNALVALGPLCYLEIIGPDPEQPRPAGPRRFGLDDLREPILLTWVAKSADLERIVAVAERDQIGLGRVIPGSRTRPDGVVLKWRYTDPDAVVADRLVPYFIDWGSSPHPAATAAKGATLAGLRAEHPNAARVQSVLDRLGLDLRVREGRRRALIATIDSPKGRVELRD